MGRCPRRTHRVKLGSEPSRFRQGRVSRSCGVGKRVALVAELDACASRRRRLVRDTCGDLPSQLALQAGYPLLSRNALRAQLGEQTRGRRFGGSARGLASGGMALSGVDPLQQRSTVAGRLACVRRGSCVHSDSCERQQFHTQPGQWIWARQAAPWPRLRTLASCGRESVTAFLCGEGESGPVAAPSECTESSVLDTRGDFGAACSAACKTRRTLKQRR